MEAIFKPEHVGHVVSTPSYGDGVITEYDDVDPRCPVTVYFEKRNITICFYADGRNMPSELPTLQFGPLDNWQRRTEPQLRDGDLVEVKNELGWSIHTIEMTSHGANYVASRTDDGRVNYSFPLDNREWRFFKP